MFASFFTIRLSPFSVSATNLLWGLLYYPVFISLKFATSDLPYILSRLNSVIKYFILIDYKYLYNCYWNLVT